MPRPRHNLTGRRFGSWTVLHPVTGPGLTLRWHCECDCGARRDVLAGALQGDRTHSCGRCGVRRPATDQPAIEEHW